MWKLFVFIVLSVCLVGQVLAVCDTLGHIDETCSMEVQFFGNRLRKAGSTQAAYEENCKMTEHGLNCMFNYATQCLKGQAATFATTLLGNLKEHYAKRCKDDAFGAIFREHSKCFDGEGVLEQFHQCEDRWYHRMQALQSLGSASDRLQNQRATCCAYFHYQQCVRDLNVAVCHDKNARFWDEIIGDVSTGATSMICPDLKTVEQCASSFPADVWAAIDGPVAAMDAAALRARNGKFKSKIITIFDMMNDFKLSPNAAV